MISDTSKPHVMSAATSYTKRGSNKPHTAPTTQTGHTAMYEFDNLAFDVDALGTRHADMLGELSLFAPFSHENEVEPDVPKMSRPVTPINEEIKKAPKTYKKLAKYVRRRIEPRPEYEHLPLEEQQGLAAVVMAEVNSIWHDLQQQLDDPFLNAEENKELERRMCVHIVTVCEQMFLHYLTKADILAKRGVFSGPANLSRLNTQLSLDTSKYLDVLTMRRYIVSDIRGKMDEIEKVTGVKPKHQHSKMVTKTGEEILSANAFSHRALIEVSRPKKKLPQKKLTTEELIEEMKRQMPTLDTSKLIPILEQMPHHQHSVTPSEELVDYSYWSPVADNISLRVEPLKRKLSEDLSKEKVLLKRSSSVPQLDTGDTLLQEMGHEDPTRDKLRAGRQHQRRGSGASLVEETLVQALQNHQKHLDRQPDVVPGTREYILADLKQLADTKDRRGTSRERTAETEDQLPPLIQALTRSSKANARLAEIEGKLHELEEREKRRIADETVVIESAKYPQPATKLATLSPEMPARTSDVRVSQRVCMSNITLQKHTPLYNDLLDELDADTVKAMDSNLFLGDEITEVYKEIMKTVPTDHLDMENDDQIEPTAGEVNLSNVMASASLSKKPSERVINPQLHRSTNPPWGREAMKDWAQTPVDPPRDFRGRPLINPRTPRGQLDPVQDLVKTPVEHDAYMPQMPSGTEQGTMQDVLARSYASWLFWWKNTLNGDDYNKYLSTQETDFMGLLFHFYNSDDDTESDSDDGDPRFKGRGRKIPKKPVEDEKEKKLEKLREEKTAYKTGEWNTRAVLMGGLGKDPVLEEPKTADTASHLATPATEDTKKTPKSKTRVTRKGLSVDEQETTTDRQTVTRTSNKSLPMSPDQPSAKSEAPPPVAAIVTPQDRLERVWSSLLMPDKHKLDMAIKYSSDEYHEQLILAIEAWEFATGLVVKREALVAQLETFERLASDPNRFFEKGYRGSAMARLNEAKTRAQIYKQIELVDEELCDIIDELQREYRDVLTYQGRPYADKMKWDRTEMLFWLQEERKQHALDYEASLTTRGGAYGKPVSIIKPAHLEPITPAS